MHKRIALYAIAGASLVPLGSLVVLLLNPYGPSFGESLSSVYERVSSRPVSLIAFLFWILIFAGLGGLLGFLGYRSEQRRRLRKNLCLGCGYDLTGTIVAANANCPECGRLIEKAASANE